MVRQAAKTKGGDVLYFDIKYLAAFRSPKPIIFVRESLVSVCVQSVANKMCRQYHDVVRLWITDNIHPNHF